MQKNGQCPDIVQRCSDIVQNCYTEIDKDIDTELKKEKELHSDSPADSEKNHVKSRLFCLVYQWYTIGGHLVSTGKDR